MKLFIRTIQCSATWESTINNRNIRNNSADECINNGGIFASRP